MLSLFLQASLLILILVTILWLWSIVIKNVSIVDVFWGFGFVVVNAYYLILSGDINARKLGKVKILDIKNLDENLVHNVIGGLATSKHFYYKVH